MNIENLHRRTGLFGVVAAAMIVVQVPLYFMYETPPDWNILTRTLIGLVGCVFYLVYFVGLRLLVERTDSALDWLAGLLQTAGLLWVAMVFVPQSMEAGAAISVDKDIDTTTEGPFAAAQYLMQGAISRLLMVLFLVTLGWWSRGPGCSAVGSAGRRTCWPPSTWRSCPRSTSGTTRPTSTAPRAGAPPRAWARCGASGPWR